MCGIAGFYSIKNVFSREDLEKMTLSLAHRGPENQSIYLQEKIGLGHRRLKIIDLSDNANQPMISKSKNSIIIFNGEIYNFKEIQDKFNISIRTSSDTEVLLEAFEKVGPKILDHLNGMFAFAIYNKKSEELFVVRDRLGIKPIFYFWDGENFAFASELKALLNVGYINSQKKLDYDAVNEYLHLGYIPEPKSVFKNINKFPSGGFAKIKNNNLQIEKYWSINDQLKSEVETDFKKAKSQLNELITKSVKYRLIADVPFGTLLSGGIDSSLVTAVAQSVSSEKVKTFSIGFEESRFNEAHHAKLVAQYLNTDHHEFIVSQNEAKELVNSILDSYDEPYADSSAIPTMLVSRLARQYVTLTLSGDGGDELFHGYGAYNWAKRLHYPFINKLKKPSELILKKLSNRYKRVSNMFAYENKETLKSHIFSQEQYFFTRKEIQLLINPEFQREISLEEETPTIRDFLAAEKQAIFDLNYYLKDDLLVKVDRASMKYSLENRVPLLDHNIVEFALNVDPRMKLKNGIQKHLLKEVLYDYVPKKFFERPKWGFAIPLVDWLKKDLKYLIEEYLSKETIETIGVVNYKGILELKNRYLLKNENYLYNRLWNLILLHKFLRNINKSA